MNSTSSRDSTDARAGSETRGGLSDKAAWRLGVSVSEYRELDAAERWPSWETWDRIWHPVRLAPDVPIRDPPLIQERVVAALGELLEKSSGCNSLSLRLSERPVLLGGGMRLASKIFCPRQALGRRWDAGAGASPAFAGRRVPDLHWGLRG